MPEQGTLCWGLSERIVLRLREVFRAHDVKDVRIFGSRATGEFHAGSDIDLYVGDELGRAEWTRLCEDIDALDVLFGVDLVGAGQVAEVLRANVERDGVDFLAQDSHR